MRVRILRCRTVVWLKGCHRQWLKGTENESRNNSSSKNTSLCSVKPLVNCMYKTTECGIDAALLCVSSTYKMFALARFFKINTVYMKVYNIVYYNVLAQRDQCVI